jgi:hypothetical protein
VGYFARILAGSLRASFTMNARSARPQLKRSVLRPMSKHHARLLKRAIAGALGNLLDGVDLAGSPEQNTSIEVVHLVEIESLPTRHCQLEEDAKYWRGRLL